MSILVRWTCGAPNNYGCFCDLKIDALYNQQAREPDEAKRIALVREHQHIALLYGVGDRGDEGAASEPVVSSPAETLDKMKALPSPGCATLPVLPGPGSGGCLLVLRLIVGGLGIALRPEVVDRDLLLVIRRQDGSKAEAAVGDDVCTRLFREARGAPEVIGVGVRNDDGMDVLDLEPGVLRVRHAGVLAGHAVRMGPGVLRQQHGLRPRRSAELLR